MKWLWERKWLIVLLLLVVGASVLAGRFRDQRDTVARDLEAAELREADLIVAQKASARDLETIANETLSLREQLAEARAKGAQGRVRTVTTTKTNPINVDLLQERDAARAELEEVVRQLADCTGADPQVIRETILSCSRATIDVRDERAELETDLGNTVLVGTAAVWRTDPPPETKLGDATFRADVSELLEVDAPAQPKSMLTALLDSELAASLLYGRRIGRVPFTRANVYAQVGGRFDFDPQEITACASYWHNDRCDSAKTDEFAVVGGLTAVW